MQDLTGFLFNIILSPYNNLKSRVYSGIMLPEGRINPAFPLSR